MGSTLFAWLLLRGRMIPVARAWLGVIASALLVLLLPLQLAGLFGGRGIRSSPVTWAVWLPMLEYEVTLALWPLIKGVAAPPRRDKRSVPRLARAAVFGIVSATGTALRFYRLALPDTAQMYTGTLTPSGLTLELPATDYWGEHSLLFARESGDLLWEVSTNVRPRASRTATSRSCRAPTTGG